LSKPYNEAVAEQVRNISCLNLTMLKPLQG